jgi:diacylglycerol kinase-like protein
VQVLSIQQTLLARRACHGRFPCSAGDLLSIRGMSRPDAPLLLGLIVHAHSRYRRLEELLDAAARSGRPVRFARTESVDELPAALRRLLDDEGVSVLGLLGGDGSIHHAVNALLGAARSGPAPPILLLCGGSMNMLARSLGIGGSPPVLLRRFLERHGHQSADEVACTEARVLAVDSKRCGRRHGFIFGSALTARLLELHEGRFGGGLPGLVRLLGAAAAGFVVRSRFWREHESLLRPAATPLLVDGRRLPYIAAAAATVPVQLLGGWVTGLRPPANTEGSFALRVVEPVAPGTVLRLLPSLLLGRPGAGIVDLQAAESLELCGDFSLDGEVYSGATPTDGLVVSAPGPKLRFVVTKR